MRTVLGLRLDLATGALSQYSGWNFNSLAIMGGELYAASDAGLFRMGGDDDAGAPIAAELALPAADFGHTGPKTLRTVDLEGRCAAGMRLVVSSDDGEERERPVEAFGLADGSPRRERVRIGRDGQGTFFSLALANEDGGDFTLSALEAAFLALDRR